MFWLTWLNARWYVFGKNFYYLPWPFRTLVIMAFHYFSLTHCLVTSMISIIRFNVPSVRRRLWLFTASFYLLLLWFIRKKTGWLFFFFFCWLLHDFEFRVILLYDRLVSKGRKPSLSSYLTRDGIMPFLSAKVNATSSTRICNRLRKSTSGADSTYATDTSLVTGRQVTVTIQKKKMDILNMNYFSFFFFSFF